MQFGRNNRIWRGRAAVLSLLTAVCVLCSCADTDKPVETSSAVSSSSTGTTASSVVTTDSSGGISSTAEQSAVPVVVESEEPPVTADAATEQAVLPTEEAPPQVELPPQTEEPPVQTTTATTTAVTTTTPATTAPPAPPVEVVIPEVMTVSSPQTQVQATDSAMIDYSNAKLGYISASYSGASARAKLRIVGNGVTYDHDLATGGIVEYFPLSQGSGDYTIAVYEQLSGKSYMEAVSAQVTLSIADEVEMYLYPNKYVTFDRASDCVYKAAELCAAADGTVEKLAAIFGWITDNVTYDYGLAATVVSGYIPDPDSLLAKRSGICFDYASLLAAMARSQGIPTRLVVGYAATDIYHAWNEVYTEETGWISAELLLSQKGYNLVDSTFYASAADKAAIADYISNNGNYSAIYRY